MSHRRFAWEHLDAALLADLTAGVDLAGETPAAWLRVTYGNRPVPEVVAEHWSALNT